MTSSRGCYEDATTSVEFNPHRQHYTRCELACLDAACGLYVCLFVGHTRVNTAKTAEPIEMSFEGEAGQTRVGSKMEVHGGATWQMRSNDSMLPVEFCSTMNTGSTHFKLCTGRAKSGIYNRLRCCCEYGQTAAGDCDGEATSERSAATFIRQPRQLVSSTTVDG